MAVLGSDNITHSTNFKFNINGADRVGITTDSRIFIATPPFTSPVPGMVNSLGPIAIYTASASPASANFRFFKTRGSTPSSFNIVSVNDELGYIDFLGADGSAYRRAALILCNANHAAAGSIGGTLTFHATPAASGDVVEIVRINSDGLYVKSTTNWTGNFSRSIIDYVGGGTQYGMTFRTASGGQSRPINFLQGGGDNGTGTPTQVGSITTDTTGTAFNTSSDYRLKENIVPISNAIDRLKQLSVYRFNFINDKNKTVDGFIAHEAQGVIPECVTGIKDEVNEEGNPVYQGIDQSKIVPLLTASLQEAIEKIETLEEKVKQLEAI
jgi:hypothetical protein